MLPPTVPDSVYTSATDTLLLAVGCYAVGLMLVVIAEHGWGRE